MWQDDIIPMTTAGCVRRPNNLPPDFIDLHRAGFSTSGSSAQPPPGRAGAFVGCCLLAPTGAEIDCIADEPV
ncbi:hypothetical protein ACOMHN_028826 [Nucella lapillus]